jgi:hypothetical protein
MKPIALRARSGNRLWRDLLAICCAVWLVPGEWVFAQEEPAAPAPAPTPAQAPAAPAEEPAAKIPPEQLDALVAPIALYPDPLLAQTLVASTYPLEIVQLQQWLEKNKDLKDQALTDAVAKQPWDPSVQSMAAFPDVVKRLADDIEWTTDLGNAFLAQQSDVMDAAQRMRKKAQANGALESNEQQKVETQVVKQDTVIVVQSANPEVIYVPTYSPVVVYGPPVYPYPPIYYPPPPPPGSAFVAFSFGVAMGAAWGGSCCYCGWEGNDININVDNNFNQINHYGGGGGNWQHNPQHRGGAPYADATTANKYGGSARGSTPNRQASASQQPAGNRAGSAGVSDRSAGGAGAGAGGASARAPSTAAPSATNRSAGSGAGSGGGDQIGNRSIPSSSGAQASNGLSSGSKGYSGSSARASSSRGSSSMGSRSSGSRGGGGRR